MILGVIRLVIFVADTALFLVAVLLASLADQEGKLAYRVARYWAWFNLRLCGIRLEVQGRQQLDPATSYVFMSNHCSNLDVLALVVTLWDFQLRWVAKEELLRIPGFGWGLRATRQIIINRADHEQAMASLARAKERLQKGVSVVFFPEGTRSSGALLPFKKGGFVFAMQTGAPIAPIAISGTLGILPRGSWLVRGGGEVRVTVQPPVATAGCSLADRDALMTAVGRSITSAVKHGAGAECERAVSGLERRPRCRLPAMPANPGGWL